MTNESSQGGSADDQNNVEELRSRPLSDEDEFYYERSYKEPVESTERIEETAKFLIGATATASGIFLAAFKLSLGNQTVADAAYYAPFICWSLSLVALVLVLFPVEYTVGKSEPASWKVAFRKARQWKYGLLFVGAMLFVAGIVGGMFSIAG